MQSIFECSKTYRFKQLVFVLTFALVAIWKWKPFICPWSLMLRIQSTIQSPLLWISDESSALIPLKKLLKPIAMPTSSVSVPCKLLTFETVSDLPFDELSKSFKARYIVLGLQSLLQKKLPQTILQRLSINIAWSIATPFVTMTVRY